MGNEPKSPPKDNVRPKNGMEALAGQRELKKKQALQTKFSISNYD
jgi:hypothetical protein